jgi:hypothetical protein
MTRFQGQVPGKNLRIRVGLRCKMLQPARNWAETSFRARSRSRQRSSRGRRHLGGSPISLIRSSRPFMALRWVAGWKSPWLATTALPQPELLELAQAYVERVILEQFIAKIKSVLLHFPCEIYASYEAALAASTPNSAALRLLKVESGI